MLKPESQHSRFAKRAKTIKKKPRQRQILLESLEPRQLLAGVPELLSNIGPDGDSSHPAEFTALNGVTYFSAQGTQLWKTDGTSAGTMLVSDTGSGVGYTYLSEFHAHDGQLVFARVDQGSDGSFFSPDDDQVQLWKSDGTSAGTVMVKDFGVGSSGNSDGAYFTSLGGTLFGVLGSADKGLELWKSDLTSAGTVLVKDINPGSAGSSPYQLFDLNGTIFFSADDGTHGRELWKTDGTESGTLLVKDIDPNSGPYGAAGSYPSSYPGGFVGLGDSFFFGARSSGEDNVAFNDDDTGQLWKSDGTTAGTVLVKDFGAGSSSGGSLELVGETIFGTVRTELGMELWKSDGTDDGTVLVKDIHPSAGSYPYSLTAVGDTLFFVADDGANGSELWKSDGTSAGTMMVKDLDPGSSYDNPIGSFPTGLTDADGTLFFSGTDPDNGSELWQSDGTSAGTMMVKDINPLTDDFGGLSSYPSSISFVNGLLFFSAFDDDNGSEPWVMNPYPWHNPANRLDVSGDQSVSPRDVLIVINRINSNQGSDLPPPSDALSPPFFDVNRDGSVSPVDALVVINDINSRPAGEGEVMVSIPTAAAGYSYSFPLNERQVGADDKNPESAASEMESVIDPWHYTLLAPAWLPRATSSSESRGDNSESASEGDESLRSILEDDNAEVDAETSID